MKMDENHEKQIKEAIKKVKLEQPSPDFINNVMQKIEASEKTMAYRPLIPRNGWLGIAAIMLIFILISFFFKDEMTLPEWTDLKKLSRYLTLDLSDKIKLSKNMIYGMLLASIMILLQIPVLKSWHSRTL